MNVADSAAVPAELRDRPQWVCWRFEERDGKSTKVPYRADGHGRASTTDPATWATFEDAVSAADWLDFDGVGFVFTDDDPFCGVDFDACLDENGLLHPDAGAILVALDSYSEVSPSGHGVKAIVRASLNGFPRHRTSATGWGGHVEVYDQARFFTVTGRLLHGCPATIEPRQEQLDEVLRLVFGDPSPASSPRPSSPSTWTTRSCSPAPGPPGTAPTSTGCGTATPADTAATTP